MNAAKNPEISVVIPARNEAASIGRVVAGVLKVCENAEIIVVNDGSTDNTGSLALEAGARVIHHPYSMGNGAAVKAGARAAQGEWIVFMDGDGQHAPVDILKLIEALREGHDMAVGARSGKSQASIGRRVANDIYNQFSSWIVGHKIEDLTSGFRAVRSGKFREFLYLLPNGFSYPTTITMAFFRSGYSVAYVAIDARERSGDSHINVMRDGVKFFLIIFKLCTLYAPLKIFFPLAFVQGLTALSYYMYTLMEFKRFTNMSAVLMTGALITFLFGLISEQITALIYRRDH